MKFMMSLAVGIAALFGPAYAVAGDYSVKLGAFSSMAPDYEGSDDMGFGGLPYLSLGWQSDPVVPKDGTGLQLGLHDITLNLPGSVDMGLVKLYRPEGLYRAAVSASYNNGRDQDDNTALNGMGDIGSHAIGTIGLEFDAKNSGLQYGLGYSADLTDETKGGTIDAELGYAYPLRKNLILTATGSTSWANKDHMQSYFGVSTAQAGTSSNAKFEASSGFKSAGAGLELTWLVNDNWIVNTTVEYTRLLNDAADSPLVKDQGSANQLAASAALIYAF